MVWILEIFLQELWRTAQSALDRLFPWFFLNTKFNPSSLFWAKKNAVYYHPKYQNQCYRKTPFPNLGSYDSLFLMVRTFGKSCLCEGSVLYWVLLYASAIFLDWQCCCKRILINKITTHCSLGLMFSTCLRMVPLIFVQSLHKSMVSLCWKLRSSRQSRALQDPLKLVLSSAAWLEEGTCSSELPLSWEMTMNRNRTISSVSKLISIKP